MPHESLEAGDPCPDCGRGTVYDTRRPGVLVRITGQASVEAKVYGLQKLRCNLCGKVFTAQAPEGVGSRKYDATAGSMIALLKYGSGMPFNRLAGLQGNLGIPLPASTQWDIVHARHLEPVFAELLRQAGQGDVVYNDDTTIKILELMGKHTRQRALAEGSVEGVAQEKQRTGLFTSGSYRRAKAAGSRCSSAPDATVAQILEAFADRATIEQDFHDIKEVWGAGQQQVRNIWTNVGVFNLNLWMHTMVELWAWDRNHGDLSDRSDSPWDDAVRHPSHANRRKTLRQLVMQREFSTLKAAWWLPRRIIHLAQRLMALAA